MADDLQERLLRMGDEGYRNFHSRLIPTIEKETIIGIKIPDLKKFAKSLTEEEKCAFIKNLPHKYYEENNLHAFVIEGIKEYDECIKEIKRFLPFVDNWATCDSLRPKCFKNHKRELLAEIDNWLLSGKIYTIRFAIEMLMVHFLEEDFDISFPEKVAKVKSDEYYVNMMISWYFATALAKRWEETIIFLEDGKLSDWVHNKTIQKAVESYRITKEQKEYLKSIRCCSRN